MKLTVFQDNGGRRNMEDRRFRIHFGPVLEKRRTRERRIGGDRRRLKDPIFRITGDERREAFRALY